MLSIANRNTQWLDEGGVQTDLDPNQGELGSVSFWGYYNPSNPAYHPLLQSPTHRIHVFDVFAYMYQVAAAYREQLTRLDANGSRSQMTSTI